jgi:hypothetical protein
MTPCWPRETTNFSKSFLQRLDTYAIAASAAGVGVLALAQPVAAKIVYRPAHVRILPNSNFNLDLNHDGMVDFVISNRYSVRSSTYNQADLWARRSSNSPAANAIEQPRSFPFSPFALRLGDKIGPLKYFGNRGVMFGYYGEGSCDGRWGNVTNRYLGVRFQDRSGKTHYGWARLTVRSGYRCQTKILATLTGYAYETVPNKPIIAGRTKGADESKVELPDAALTSPIPDQPQPASLGALAMGTPGLSIWRREELAGTRSQAN